VAALNAGIGLARIHQAQGKLDKARELIHLLYEDTYRLQNTDLLPLLESAQAELQLAEGNTALALRWAQEFQPQSVQDNLLYLEVPFLTQVRILVAHGSVAAVRAAGRYLEQRLSEMQEYHFTIRVIQISSHLALVYDRLKRPDGALASLRRALTLGRSGGFIRPFVECGPVLLPLLEQLRQEDTFPEYVSQVLAGFGVQAQTTARVAPWSGPVEPLTRREMEVLRLIQAQMTNQEIAEELVISLPTVKRHTSNIYGKLAVSRRRQAVRKAMELGLLPAN
jgi:LuxR family maltose regulon positive regulatory protein